MPIQRVYAATASSPRQPAVAGQGKVPAPWPLVYNIEQVVRTSTVLPPDAPLARSGAGPAQRLEGDHRAFADAADAGHRLRALQPQPARAAAAPPSPRQRGGRGRPSSRAPPRRQSCGSEREQPMNSVLSPASGGSHMTGVPAEPAAAPRDSPAGLADGGRDRRGDRQVRSTRWHAGWNTPRSSWRSSHPAASCGLRVATRSTTTFTRAAMRTWRSSPVTPEAERRGVARP